MNDDLAALSDYRLKQEFLRLDVQREALSERIRELEGITAGIRKSVRISIGLTTGGGAVTLAGIAFSLINPLSAALALAGFGLAYLGGKSCVDDQVRVQELRARQQRLADELERIVDRLEAIAALRRSRRGGAR